MVKNVSVAKRYRAHEGPRFSDDDAQRYGEAIDGLPVITAEAVVEAARNKKSPLHDFFEWRDNVAAEEYRKAQARIMLASIDVVIDAEAPQSLMQGVDLEVNATVAKAFWNVHSNGEDRCYISLENAASNADHRRELLGYYLNRGAAYVESVRPFEEFAPIIHAFDRVKKSLEL